MPPQRGKTFYADPPDAESLRVLLHYYVQSGIGLPVSDDGVAERWTDTRLEAALAGIGIAVDRRSIQSWLSGASIPKVQKLKGLASLASSNRFEREKWSAAFIRLRQAALDARRAQRKPPPAEPEDPPAPAPPATADTGAGRQLLARAAAILTGLAGVSGAAYGLAELLVTEPVASNIRFCDEANFSTQTKRCLRAMTDFPDGLHTLMITFDLTNVAEGETFTRKWYRNGRLIHEKTSFNDEAWPGYTFWHWPEGFDTGAYALQIVSGDKAVTATFHVGKGEGRLNYR